MNASLPVRIASLAPGLHTLRLTPPAETLGLDPAQFSEVTADVSLDIGTNQIVATVEVSATAHLVCDRTAVPFDQLVGGTHTVLFTQNAAMVDDADDDVRLYGPHDTTIDLGNAVHDTLLLALPQRRLAPGAEDLDVPTRFGAPDDLDAPADDRWDALRRLRDGGTLN